MLKKLFFCPKCLDCVTPPAALFEKMKGSDVSQKNGVFGKIGRVI